jgi:hypothetical protein
MRKLFLLIVALLALPGSGATVDRIAAVVEQQVITVSEVSQMVTVRFFPNNDRRQVLEALIAQALRFRDVERFGAQEIPADTIEARVVEIRGRHPSPAAFESALEQGELTLDELRALVKRQLQVEAYIQERFAPTIFVSNEEIEQYYQGPWRQQRRERGLPVVNLEEVRSEIRDALRASRLQEEIAEWTTQLRARANVDVYAWR